MYYNFPIWDDNCSAQPLAVWNGGTSFCQENCNHATLENIASFSTLSSPGGETGGDSVWAAPLSSHLSIPGRFNSNFILWLVESQIDTKVEEYLIWEIYTHIPGRKERYDGLAQTIHWPQPTSCFLSQCVSLAVPSLGVPSSCWCCMAGRLI